MRFTTTLLAVFVAVAAAKPHGSCPPKDPCKKVDCDYNEVCEVVYGEGVCKPKKDGHSHGNDGHNVDPCKNYHCGKGEVCELSYGKPVCKPKKGDHDHDHDHDNDNDHGHKDPCKGYYCGKDEVCEVCDGKATCKPKKTFDPCSVAKCAFGPCKVVHGKAVCPKDPCDGYDCGYDKVCEVEDHKAVCKPKKTFDPCSVAKCAFGPCKVVDGKAVCPKDPCDGYDCGYDKVCKVEDHKAVCKPKDGGHLPVDPCASVRCLWGTCEVKHGKPECPSKPDPVKCGTKTCPLGQVCCNASCGTCVKPGMACTQIACLPHTQV